MAITLAQATCVRASVGALGVSGAPRVMEAGLPWDAQLVGRMGERMGQPPSTHVGGQGRTPASAVMAITLAQATCVRASVGALGVCGAQHGARHGG
ncbi:MAG: hypothetical protein WDW38_010493 [Sanguina aurantia]